jgi:hypothetical protein
MTRHSHLERAGRTSTRVHVAARLRAMPVSEVAEGLRRLLAVQVAPSLLRGAKR